MFFVDANSDQVLIGSNTAVGSAQFVQRFTSADTYSTTNDTRYSAGKHVIFNESNTTDTFAGLTLLTGASTGGTVELNAIRTSTGNVSDFVIKNRDAGGNSSEKIRMDGATGNFGVGDTSPDSKISINGHGGFDTDSTATSATTQTAVYSFSATTFVGAKLLVCVTDSTATERYITEILVTHDGTTAVSTEYGQVATDTALATFDVDISGGNVRLLATPASSNSMTFKVMSTQLLA